VIIKPRHAKAARKHEEAIAKVLEVASKKIDQDENQENMAKELVLPSNFHDVIQKQNEKYGEFSKLSDGQV